LIDLTVSEIQSIEAAHTSGVYSKRDIVIVRGEGALLYDTSGRSYIDCVGGQGTANLGHAHPAIVNAITDQAQRLISLPESFYNDKRAALLSRLVSISPVGMDRVFLCNAGTEAIEAAIKFARFSTGRPGIVAAMRGFHGRTMGALSATWNKHYREPFNPLVPGFQHVVFNKLSQLEENVNENVAAVLLEIVQGEGGVHPGTREFLQGAQEICNERGALLIIDEVQTGFGRTGKMFALEHFEILPDLLAVAKSIGGGVPLGAVMIGPKVRSLSPGIHGSTFGGNPLSAAAGAAAIDVITSENLADRAAESGAYLMAGLMKIDSPLIREVRGLGLMVGIELKEKAAPYLQSLAEEGVLALSAGMTVIRLLPPLVITRSQIDDVIEAIRNVLSAH